MFILKNSEFPPASTDIKIQRIQFRLNKYRFNSNHDISKLVEATASFLDEINKQIDLIKTYNDNDEDKQKVFKEKKISEKLDNLIFMFDNELQIILNDKI